ncbi:MAG: hypothetical protein P1V35_06850 [Planctomycetota bacterium]|nr:hypothetical protein [Planctomycetota bacterium]
MLQLLSVGLTGSLALAGSLLLPAPEAIDLTTDYASLQLLRVEREASFSIETTVMEMEIDGEPVDRGGRGMGSMSTTTRSVVLNDYKATAEGVPSHIIRTFEELGGTQETPDGEQELPANPAQPAAGLKIDISLDEEGDQKITVVEGEAPENETFMESQPMTLALDSLLPTEAVEVDGTWDLESEAITGALGRLMPQRAPRPQGEGRRRGGDRMPQDGPPQGRRQGRGGNSMGQFLREVEWSGEAKLISVDTEHEGEKCAVIEFTMEAAGDLPERQGGGGRRGGGGDRALEWNPQVLPVEGEAEVKLTGKLYFSIAGKHPVALNLEGELASSNSMVRERGERTMSMYSEQEGEISLSYTFTHEER